MSGVPIAHGGAFISWRYPVMYLIRFAAVTFVVLSGIVAAALQMELSSDWADVSLRESLILVGVLVVPLSVVVFLPMFIGQLAWRWELWPDRLVEGRLGMPRPFRRRRALLLGDVTRVEVVVWHGLRRSDENTVALRRAPARSGPDGYYLMGRFYDWMRHGVAVYSDHSKRVMVIGLPTEPDADLLARQVEELVSKQ
ncbi:hypothetical protein [Phytoactinopolyspora mesophila]|uniref:Uncharacterized protein n=1 Tax=Phytoactinopolyspora mesophila TaxID=2650750 RepID=A0A7K3LYP1_9ACTN|nr:hypothetical protein [Phytoactinopolyspora mesophila]NDL56161.1 hypothetical protein [Phytoactinopolyspora mesophila]